MTQLRNRAGQLAVVVPFGGAAEDIKAHGGKVVTPIEYAVCELGGSAWRTFPILKDAYGNTLSWDDLDLKPLGNVVASDTKLRVATV